MLCAQCSHKGPSVSTELAVVQCAVQHSLHLLHVGHPIDLSVWTTSTRVSRVRASCVCGVCSSHGTLQMIPAVATASSRKSAPATSEKYLGSSASACGLCSIRQNSFFHLSIAIDSFPNGRLRRACALRHGAWLVGYAVKNTACPYKTKENILHDPVTALTAWLQGSAWRKMASPRVAASREHALAVTRDYISQPRLSEFRCDDRIYCLSPPPLSPSLSLSHEHTCSLQDGVRCERSSSYPGPSEGEEPLLC